MFWEATRYLRKTWVGILSLDLFLFHDLCLTCPAFKSYNTIRRCALGLYHTVLPILIYRQVGRRWGGVLISDNILDSCRSRNQKAWFPLLQRYKDTPKTMMRQTEIKYLIFGSIQVNFLPHYLYYIKGAKSQGYLFDINYCFFFVKK